MTLSEGEIVPIHFSVDLLVIRIIIKREILKTGLYLIIEYTRFLHDDKAFV